MNGRAIAILVASFFAGAVLMIFIRGAGTASDTQPPADAPTGTDVDAAPANPEAGLDRQQGEVLPAPGPRTSAPDSSHAGHVMPATDAAPEEASGDAYEAEATTKARIWTCEQDETIGLSWAGKCPLDGKPMVEREVDLAAFTDVENQTCPIMGGQTNPEVYALYKDKQVRFCCKGCDIDFFADPETHITRLEQ